MTFAADNFQTSLDVTDVRCDKFEQNLLPIIRHFLQAFSGIEPEAWQIAYSLAEERWGPSIGLPLGHDLAKMLRALTRVRSEDISYHDPLRLEARSLVTPDEIALLQTIHYMRRDITAEARKSVFALTKGIMDPDFIRAALKFSNRNGIRIPKQRQSQKQLRVVSSN